VARVPATQLNRTILQALFTQGAAGQLDLVVAPAAGLKIYVVQIVLSMTATGTVTFQEGTGPTNLSGALNIPAGSPLVLVADGKETVLQTNTAGVKLGLTSVTGAAVGFLRYFLAAE
jgi:hypothetical protein